jgi:hypothetical protein
MSGTQRDVAIVVGVVLGFFVVLIPITMAYGAMIAEASGWRRAAARFPAGDMPPDGRRFWNQVTAVGTMNENAVTRVVVAPSGLHLSVILLLRFRRPPILVPWEHVTWKAERHFLWIHHHRLDLGGLTTLTLRDKAYRAAAPYLTRPGPSV